MVTIRSEQPADIAPREALLDEAFGTARFTKTAARLRDGRLHADGLSFVATRRGRVVGTVRLWHVRLGTGSPALLLGPLAVATEVRGQGIGSALMRHALRAAANLGHAAILLVGDAPYYARFGFSAARTLGLRLPGPYEHHRLLACELAPGALDGAHGMICATGQRAPMPRRVTRHAAVTRAA